MVEETLGDAKDLLDIQVIVTSKLEDSEATTT